MHRRHLSVIVLAAAIAAALTPVAARAQARQTQTAPPQRPTPPVTVYETQPSYQTVNELRELLNRYPPNVRLVLQLDPSLLDRPEYLEPYPALASFLQQHPEIRRNPSFFLGEPERRRDDNDPKRQAIDLMSAVLAGGALFTGFMVVLGVLASLVRQLIQAMRGEVQLPAAGQVWWRAAVRARMEAAHTASRPITWTQGLAAAGAIGLFVALIGIAWPSLTGSLDWIVGEASRLDPARTEMAGLLVDFLRRSLPLLIGVALCAVLAPVAVYFALSDE